MNVSLPVKPPTPASDLSHKATPWARESGASIRTVIDTGSDDPERVRAEVVDPVVPASRASTSDQGTVWTVVGLAAAAALLASRLLR